MILLSDHDVVGFPEAWGSFQKLGLNACYTLASLVVGEA